MRKLDLLSALAGCLLIGCSSPPVVKPDEVNREVDARILEAAHKIEAAQLQLHRSTGLDSQIAKGQSIPARNAGRITLSWRGDASQLLARLAQDTGLTFTQMGVKMPLPVSIEVNDQPLAVVFDQIRLQTGYRATIETSVTSLVLLYNRPQF